MSDFGLFMRYLYNLHNLDNSYGKVNFLKHIKKLFFKIFTLHIKILRGYYIKKNKEKLSRKARKMYQSFSEKKKKAKSVNMLLCNIEIFLV